MTVLEMQSPSRPAVRWTEVCTTEHDPSVRGSAPLRSAVVPARSVAPARRVRVRPVGVSGTGVRACRVDTAAGAAVVDDVPTWALLACGVVFGLVLLLLVALVGGPAYA